MDEPQPRIMISHLADPWVGYGSSPWGTSHPPDGMLLLSRSILPLCGSWRKMSAGANVTWASKEYRDTLQDLVMSCSKGVTKVSQDLMVKVSSRPGVCTVVH